MNIILDLLLLLIVALCIWDGYKRGLIGGIAGIFAIIIALLAGSSLSDNYASEAVPVLEPFVDGYIDSQKTRSAVLEEMGYGSTDLSLEDVLESDSFAWRKQASMKTVQRNWQNAQSGIPIRTACR